MSPQCLTDFISIDKLQVMLDETSQQDGIALRVWFPEENGWGQEWVNECNFHTLIRSYPTARQLCKDYFAKRAQSIIKNHTLIHGANANNKCPTSLYVFGYPIIGPNKIILAILFGGLVRDENTTIPSKEWKKVKKDLIKDNACLAELKNEYQYAPSLDKTELKKLFNKWQLFCELLSRQLSRGREHHKDSDHWVEQLIGFHRYATIAVNLTEITGSRKQPLTITLTDGLLAPAKPNHYHTQIHYRAELVQPVNTPLINTYNFPINNKNTLSLGIEKISGTSSQDFIDKLNQNIITGILTENENNSRHNRKLILERQAHIFNEVSKQAVTDISQLIRTLFSQLDSTGVIRIDYASFSEVVFFPDDKDIACPTFKASVVYPKGSWTPDKCTRIEELSLNSNQDKQQGSTVWAYQRARPVLDRITKESPTYIETQPDVCSSLVIPINYGPLLLGVLAFDSVEEGYFNNARKLQLESLTQLLSPIIYHNNFQKELKDLNQKIEKIGRNTDAKKRPKIRLFILKALSRLIQAEGASFWEKDPTSDQLIRGNSIGIQAGFLKSVELDDSVIGSLFKGEKDFELVKNLETSKRQSGLKHLNILKEQQVSSYLAFPVTIGDKKVILSFYRFKHPELVNRDFSNVEVNTTQRLGQMLAFYETLNDIFSSQHEELKIQLKSRKELSITLAHNIQSPLSSAYARLDDLQRKMSLEKHKLNDFRDFTKIFDKINSNFYSIKRTTRSILNQLSTEEKFEGGMANIKGFHLFFDILSREVSKVRQGLKLNELRNPQDTRPLKGIKQKSSDPKSAQYIHKRRVNLYGNRQFPFLYGDKDAIEDLFSNLLQNAVKYSYSEDQITVETQFDYLKSQINVLISNTGGIEIPKEDIDRIFLYSYRSENAINKNPSSTGVGLFYSRFIAEQHGASLTLESRKDPVVFKVSFPIYGLSNAERAEKTIENNRRKKGKLHT